MKYDNLSYRLQNKMRAEYDKRHADKVPVEPTPTENSYSARKVIQTGHKTDLYVTMTTPSRKTDYASGYLRLVASNEHIEIELPLDKLEDIIDQLQALKADMSNHKHFADQHRDELKQYHADKEAYEDKRERDLTKALSSGKITAEQIRSSLDIITF